MQTITEPINERSTRVLTVPLYDQAGLPLTAVTTLTASLRDLTSGTLIRDAQSVLNANGGTFADGVLTLLLAQTDTQVIGTASLQPRVLTLDARTATLRITEEVQFLVRALADITA